MKRIVCGFSALALALLVLACPNEVPTGTTTLTGDEVAAVLALSGPELYNNGSVTNIAPVSRASRAAGSGTVQNDGPNGGSLSFTYEITGDSSPFQYEGTVTYSGFAVEYEGAIYTLNGSYDIVMSMSIDENYNSVTSLAYSGSIAIAKGDATAVTVSVDLVATTTMTTSESGITMVLTSTGTVNGEAVNVNETITIEIETT